VNQIHADEAAICLEIISKYSYIITIYDCFGVLMQEQESLKENYFEVLIGVFKMI
jgi:hypothetical protein